MKKKLLEFAFVLYYFAFNTTNSRMAAAGVFIGVSLYGYVHGYQPFNSFAITLVVAVLAFFAGRRFEADKAVREGAAWWNHRTITGKRARFAKGYVVAVEGVEGDPLQALLQERKAESGS